jgi:hypothetical protein
MGMAQITLDGFVTGPDTHEKQPLGVGGGGTRQFAGLRPGPIRLERTRLIDGEPTTHLRFRVLR